MISFRQAPSIGHFFLPDQQVGQVYFRALETPSPSDKSDKNLPNWDLTDLYPSMDSTQYSQDVSRAETLCQEFAATYEGKLTAFLEKHTASENSAYLFEAIRRYESAQELMGRIMSYAYLLYKSNMHDIQRVKFLGDAQENMTRFSLNIIFFTLELNQLSDAPLQAAMQETPLNHYRPWLEEIRRERPYQLEQKIEQLFQEKSVTSFSAWNRLFDETVTALQFRIDEKDLSLEPALALLQDPRSEIRHEAGKVIGKTLSNHKQTFTLILNTIAKDLEISNRWRGFQNPADSRHLANSIEPSVVEALVEAVTAAYPQLSHRYYRLKAKWFAQEKLSIWDRNAPLPQAETPIYSWDEAQKIVLRAYHDFSPELAQIGEEFFNKNWIDVPVRPGKASGAFAHATVPSVHPYILLNYQGRMRDVTILAHELGHGIHQVLSKEHGILMTHAPLTFAETASVFGEMLTFQTLLAQSDKPEVRKSLLATKVEDMINSVVRQIAFYVFENKIHAERQKGELTSEQICDLWYQVQKESLGPHIDVPPEYNSLWTYIGHFIHAPFYVYAYAFGDCLVNSLYATYQKQPENFAQRYIALLAAGGTKPHKELLAPFSLDASDPSFWKSGLTLLDSMITELEQMS